MRNSVVVIHDPVKGAIHFCETSLQGEDRWFPFVGDSNDLFGKIEQLMVDNAIANNVTSVEALRQCGKCLEYTVVYNELQKSPPCIERGDSVHNPSINKTGVVFSVTEKTVVVRCHDGEHTWEKDNLEVIPWD